VIAWSGLIPFQKNRPGSEWGSVVSKESNFFLDIYPGTLAINEKQPTNQLLEEAIQDLLKKYKKKAKE